MQESSRLSGVALAQMEVVPGQPWINLQTALRLLEQARGQGCSLVAFPELCLSGYMLGDRFEELAFLEDCQAAGEELMAALKGISIVYGNVGLDLEHIGEDGRPRLYNAAFMAEDGAQVFDTYTGLPFIPKTLLPNYREFEDTRHFYDLRRLARERGVPLESLYGPHRLAGMPVGVLLCEDGWGEDYGENLVAGLASRGAQLVLDLSASPYTRGKNGKRHRVFSRLAKNHGLSIAYVNCVGSQNNGKTCFGFDGCSAIYGKDGEVVFQAPAWENRLLKTSDILSTSPSVKRLSPESASPWAGDMSEFVPEDFQTLENVIRRYLQGAGLSRVVIGVSGGVDSAVAAALFAHICGPGQVLLASMPSQYNSATTRGLSAQLAANLGCWYVEVPIGESVELTRRQIDGLEAAGPGGTTLSLALSAFHLENVQARDRSSRVLSALASAFGGVFTCNANKAETTVGYSTLYGDHGGFLAPLADLWKSEVYALGRYLNDKIWQRDVIPEGIFTIKPSAELSPGQNPEQGGGDPILYAYHDRLFHAFMQRWRRVGPEEILQWYANGELETELGLGKPVSFWFADVAAFVADLERWWKLFTGMGVVKRVQAPPIVALSRRAYGFDYRESILPGVWFSRRYTELKTRLLDASSLAKDER